jgi:hypothetical protein
LTFRAKAFVETTNFPTKDLCSKRRSSPCIFQVVVSLSIRSFRIIIPPPPSSHHHHHHYDTENNDPPPFRSQRDQSHSILLSHYYRSQNNQINDTSIPRENNETMYSCWHANLVHVYFTSWFGLPILQYSSLMHGNSRFSARDGFTGGVGLRCGEGEVRTPVSLGKGECKEGGNFIFTLTFFNLESQYPVTITQLCPRTLPGAMFRSFYRTLLCVSPNY